MHLVQVAEEIIQLLASDPNAALEITLEINAEFANGASNQIKRAVSENATNLGFMSNANGESDFIPTESRTTCTVGNLSRGSRETPAISVSSMEAVRSEKARCHTSVMYVAGESDHCVVPVKPTNNGNVPLPADLVEGRQWTKENTEQSLLDRTQRRNSDGSPFVPRSRGLLGIRQAAQQDKKFKFTSLLLHITPELLQASFLDLKKQAAPGVDGETWRDYANDFERRIEDLHGQIHRGAYRALCCLNTGLQADVHP